jgi:hypothetical protein
MFVRLAGLVVVVAVLALPHQGHAEDGIAPDYARWVTLGWLSAHINPNHERNGLNYGLGFEVGLNERWAVAGGVYQNSFSETSYYGGGVLQVGSSGALRWGLMLGVANGYQRVNEGGLFPYVFPILQYERDAWGANLAVIPPASRMTRGLVALQFKFRY